MCAPDIIGSKYHVGPLLPAVWQLSGTPRFLTDFIVVLLGALRPSANVLQQQQQQRSVFVRLFHSHFYENLRKASGFEILTDG